MDARPRLVGVFKHDRSILVFSNIKELLPCLQRAFQPLFQIITMDAIQIAKMTYYRDWLEYLNEIKTTAQLVSGCFQDIFILGPWHYIVERCMQGTLQTFFFKELSPVLKVLSAESIQRISIETDLGVNSVFYNHLLVFTKISKGYVDKALGNDVLELGFHGRICYCENEKKLGEFVDAEYFLSGIYFGPPWYMYKKKTA